MRYFLSQPINICIYILLSLNGFNLAHADTFNVSDDVAIDYEVKGSGEPLVLLHSGMMSREDMRVQIDHFSNSYMVIALDSREQGRSSVSKETITYDLMASDVVALLDHLEVKSTNIFGQSDGGITALLVAHKYPDRVKKAVIHGAVYNHSAYPEGQKQGWKNYTFDQNNDDHTNPAGFPGMAIEHYLLGRADLSNFEAHLQEMAMMWATSPNLSISDLSKIQVPVMLIVGDHWDISIPHTVEMHEALPNSELFVVPGGTHFIHQEKPDLLHRVIEDYLKTGVQ